MHSIEQLWVAVRSGKNAALVGTPSVTLPIDWTPLVVRVACDRARGPLGPLLEARERVERLVGAPARRAGVVVDLRRRLLGDVTDTSPESFVDALNQLALRCGRDAIMIFDGVDVAAEATIHALRRIVGRPGLCSVPIVIGLRDRPAKGAAALLLDALRSGGGAALEMSEEASGDSSAKVTPPLGLSSDALWAVRAIACAGELEARVVASRLEMTEARLLRAIQDARDAGAPIEDLGAGRFALPANTAAAVRAELLPSVVDALSGAPRPIRMPTIPPLEGAPPLAEATSVPTRLDLTSEPPPPMPKPSPSPSEPPPRLRVNMPEHTLDLPSPLHAPHVPTDLHPAHAASTAAPGARPLPIADAAILEARRVEAIGGASESVKLLERALDTLGEGGTEDARRARVHVLAELGRVVWQGAGTEHDFTLAGAFATLLRAIDALDKTDPPALHARVAALFANVCYDLGDMRSLERAEAELSRASRALLEDGDAYGAARLLNDQAAIYVRMGDTVRAAHLLEQSRKVFEERADLDPTALAELAETLHLLARLPLHAPLRVGRELEAIAAAASNAKSAEAMFKRLRAVREVARVNETLGRLALAADDPSAATSHLAKAIAMAGRTGDAVGLARAAAAMSDALAALGKYEEAALLLADSVRMNLAKGSPIGFAFNKRACRALREAARAKGPVPRAIEEVDALLTAAMSEIGGAEEEE
jgi:tetratricopeptide (TPR) repeat protein